MKKIIIMIVEVQVERTHIKTMNWIPNQFWSNTRNDGQMNIARSTLEASNKQIDMVDNWIYDCKLNKLDYGERHESQGWQKCQHRLTSTLANCEMAESKVVLIQGPYSALGTRRQGSLTENPPRIFEQRIEDTKSECAGQTRLVRRVFEQKKQQIELDQRPKIKTMLSGQIKTEKYGSLFLSTSLSSTRRELDNSGLCLSLSLTQDGLQVNNPI